ncbi:MAG: CCA tRNA nucleotidyltransferase [Pseudomonadota bacterium]
MIILDRHLEIKSKHFMVIINHLNSNGGNSRLVGGVVRDSLLGSDSSDIDIATDLAPDRVTEILTSYGIKVIPTGIKFGTVTAVLKDESFEITTLRKDINCDGRHASVEYSNDFAEDAARRDFTINALSYCPIQEKIYDYYGGLADLEARKVVFIGDAAKRVQEDYLRILRFFRFSSRYAKDIDSTGLKICTKFKERLKSLSQERIKSETDGLMLSVNAPKMLQVMNDYGILSEILPVENYDLDLHLQALSLCEQFKIAPTLSLMYSVLFMHNENITFSNLMDLKFSKIDANIIMKMHLLMDLQDKHDLMYSLKNIWLEEKDFLQYFIISSLLFDDNQFIYNLYKKLAEREVPVFPIVGDDILILGYQGKEVGRILGYLKKKWIKSDFKDKKSFLLDMVLENEK